MDWNAHTLGQALTKCYQEQSHAYSYISPSVKRTWGETFEQAQVFAKALLAANIKKGDLVGLLCANDENWIDFFFGAALIGAITVPVNTRFKSLELSYCLQQADVKLLLTMDRFLNIDFIDLLTEAEPSIEDHLPGQYLPFLNEVVVLSQLSGQSTLQSTHQLIETYLPKGCTPLSTFLSRGQSISVDALSAAMCLVTPEDVLLIQFTSGTTAFPKGVMLSHENMLHNASAVSSRIGLSKTDRYFNCRPFFHVAGSTLSLLATLETQSCLVTLPTFEAGAALHLLEKEQCTFISGNETIFQLLLNHPDFDVKKLTLKGGWAASGPKTMYRIVHEMGIRDICWSYGQSEASPNIVKSDYRDPIEDRIDGLAKPLPGVEVAIIDPSSLQPLPFGEAGEILVRGWNVMKGYYGKLELTQATIDVQGWLHTGDLGLLTPAGHLRFIARLKDVFRVGGENVAPAEVEEVILGHKEITMAQVSAFQISD